jgi:signal transduction histidine kinase
VPAIETAWSDKLAAHSAGRRAEKPSPRWMRRVVTVSLLRKLIVTDLLINLLALSVVNITPPAWTTEVMVTSLLVTLAINAALVYWGLVPLRALEMTAVRVSRGDLQARFELPPFADRNIARIGLTLNELLDGLTADRLRVRHLAAQVISAGDHERAHIARELHDSTAQSLSALEMILSSALRDPAQASPERLQLMREITTQALWEVRTLSQNVHPRVLDDLGLVAALEYLARRTREQSQVPVWVTADEQVPVPPAVASVLYRVAQAAVSNAARHAKPTELHLSVTSTPQGTTLEVKDDGIGFDPAAAEAARTGMGLFLMRERLGLVNGQLTVVSVPGTGATIRASVPTDPAAL